MMVFNGFFRADDRYTEIEETVKVISRQNVAHALRFRIEFICDCFLLYLVFLDGSIQFTSTRLSRILNFRPSSIRRRIIKKKKKRIIVK